MHTIRIKDKEFAPFIPEAEIQARVARVAEQISRDYAGRRPVFLVVLSGAFVFAADLLRRITLEAEVCFIRLASYEGLASTGQVCQVLGLDRSIENRPVIVVEDIVDTGLTMQSLLALLASHSPESVEVCTLFLKPESLRVPLRIRYWCQELPSRFVVGYGLDYDQLGRNLPEVYALKET